MKRIFIWAIGVFGATLLLGQQPNYVSGKISKDTRWSGDVHINGDVVVARNATLTIDAGTRIFIAPHQDVTRGGTDPELTEIIILGKLVARGAERGGRILFTSAAKAQRMRDWYGIVIKGRRQQSELRNCIIEYAYKGITAYGSAPVIENCEVRFNFYIGISAEVRAKPTIRNCLILGNGVAGINCELGSAPLVEGNIINQNTNGVIIFDRSNPDIGHQPAEGVQSKGGNRIFNNFEYDIYNHSSMEIYAQNNLWNTEDVAEIRKRIFDREDNAAYGPVIFEPYFGQTQPPIARRRALPPVPSIALESSVSTNGPENRGSASGTRNNVSANKSIDTLAVAEQRTPSAENISPVPVKRETVYVYQPPPEPSKPEKTEAKKEESPPKPQIQEPVLEAFLDGGKRQYIRRVKPEYPKIYLNTGTEGTVILQVVVGRDGRVESYRVLRSDGELFTAAAIDAIKQYRYKPGTMNGKPVKFRVIERFRFKIGG